MADADEDVIPRSTQGGEDHDLSDETQDFRFLASISREDAAIPKRGEKDFEPHATALQSNTLEASRQAMHNALAFHRTHIPKNHSIAVYHPETNMAYALNPKGPLFSRMGHVPSAKDDPLQNAENRGQRVWLYPEEALYLLERGTLDVHWPVVEDDENDFGLPMSLQAGYAMFIGDELSHGGALTMERYQVYAGLKRAGYTVMRAPTWNSLGPPIDSKCYPAVPVRTWWVGIRDTFQLHQFFIKSPQRSSMEDQMAGPLVTPGLYRSYVPIYERLAMIPAYDPTEQRQPSDPSYIAGTDSSFRITYHVWKPGSTTFKKSNPPPPDFRIAVVNARETTVPSLSQLSGLLETMPYDAPKEDAKLYARLKHGYKSVILAIVDQGVTSYLRLADAGFTREKLYEFSSRGPGAKRGGRGGAARGRSRGRGRG